MVACNPDDTDPDTGRDDDLPITNECSVDFVPHLSDTNNMPLGTNFRTAVYGDSKAQNTFFNVWTFRHNIPALLYPNTFHLLSDPCVREGNKQIWETDFAGNYQRLEVENLADSFKSSSVRNTSGLDEDNWFLELQDHTAGGIKNVNNIANLIETSHWQRTSEGVYVVYTKTRPSNNTNLYDSIVFRNNGSGYFLQRDIAKDNRRVTIWNTDGSGSYTNQNSSSYNHTW